VESEDAQAIDIGRYVRVLWTNAWIVVLMVVVAAGIVYKWSSGQPKVFESTATVRVFDPSDPSVSSGGVHVDPAREVDIQVLYAQSPAVLAEYRKRMGKSVSQIKSQTVAPLATVDAMTIAVDSGNKAVAQKGAATYAQAYVDLQRAALARRFGSQADALRAQATDLQTQMAGLDKQIADLQPTGASHVVVEGGRPIVVPESDQLRNLGTQRADLAARSSDLVNQAGQAEVESRNRQADIDIVQSPAAPKDPVSPKPLRDAAIAGMAGLLISLGIVVLRHRLRQRIARTDDVKTAAPEIPFVTAIPPNQPRFARRNRSPSLDLVSSSDGRLAEAYRTLRAGLRFATAADTSLVVLVTSARPGEGKTTTAANLGVSLAQAGERVVVVDGDLRHANIHDLFVVPNTVGFASVVVKSVPLKEALQKVVIPGGSLDVLPAGPRVNNPAEILLSDKTSELLAELRSRYDYVIVDSPPVLPVADALTLARSVDGVLLVVRAGRTRAAAFRQADQLLRQFDAPIQGAVVVGAGHERSYGGYYDYPANTGLGARRRRKLVKQPDSTPPVLTKTPG
jgi:succinoglycan biosynthesis transport protein ExoP